MKILFYYILQVVIASGILYAYYHFFLRNNKFHRYNRFYILAAILISILIPFLNIPIYFTAEDRQSSLVFQTLTVFSSSQSDEIISTHSVGQIIKVSWFTWENVLFGLYILISCFALARIIISLKKIRQIIQTNPVEELDDIHFVNTGEPGTPYSFFRWLFWNRKIELQSEKGEQIFRHELFHIKEKHSWDILFTELLTVIFWINPFFHLMKKELKAIHEFLADQFAVTENKNWEYAELLLMQALNTQNHLTNPFFHNQIKRRIAMLTTSTKPGHQYLRKVLVLPVAAIVLALFAFKYKEKISAQDKMNDSSKNNLALQDTIKPPSEKITTNAYMSYTDPDGSFTIKADTFHFKSDPNNLNSDLKDALIIVNGKKESSDFLVHKNIIAKAMIVYSKNDPQAITKFGIEAKNGVIAFENATITNTEKTKKTIADTINPNNKIFEKVEVEAAFPGGEPAWKKYLERNLVGINPADKGAPNGTYTVLVQFIVDKEGKTNDVKALTHFGHGMEEAAINVIKKGPSWIPALQNGHKVKAYKKQPITFVVMGGKTSTGNTLIHEVTLEDKSESLNPELNKALFVVDGKITDNSVLQNISPENINSIQIIKDAPAIAEYGERGKYGVVKITTRNNQNVKMKEVILSEKNSGDNKIFEKTEISPSFPGGKDAWQKYIQQTLVNFNPADSGAKEGTYTVIAQFIVDKEGAISDVKTLTHFGHGMEDKVIEIIQNGPKWKPAIQNSHKVKAYVKQPVTFVVQDETEETTTKIPLKENIDPLSAVYPNPTNNSVTIPFKSEIEGKGEIRVYDETGSLKKISPVSFLKGANNYNVNISSLAKGIYIINVIGVNKAITKSYKMIKE